ncbi:capsid cement protein [Ralstonia solanacearum]|uniref:capsid cement protein n=1 Tax=Ralstonia pseudosolanacearum TaxID=1310165 RepID=UPI001C011352|nr:DUF2190 family protein [Ralstonia solanacearum]
MKTQQPTLTTSITATAALARFRFVGLTGAVCAAAAKALGTAETTADIGEQASVNVSGILLVEAAAVIAAGAEVESDANGKAITKAAGISNGFALDAAAAAGDVIRIVRGI